jgi:nucleoside-diphosphate kinase
MERTLILVKPDAFARNLTGEIIARFERKGLRLVALQQLTMTRELAQQHYAEHEGKPFFEELVAFITSGPLVAMALEGDHAVVAARQVIGSTNPLAVAVGQNMVHGSDSPESGVRELGLFFPDLR